MLNRVTHKEPWYKYYTNKEEIKYPDMTIYELIEKTAMAYPNNYAFEYYGKKITYREFLMRIKKTAGSLIELGVKEGDRVTICMPNTPEVLISLYALNYLGQLD